MKRHNKIKNLKEVCKLAREHQKKARRLVLCLGTFDIFHKGHILLFLGALKAGDVLIVGVDHDANVSYFKGSDRPFNSQRSRMFVLSHITLVDYVFPISKIRNYQNKSNYFRTLLSKLRPDVIASNMATSSNAVDQKLDAEYINAEFLDVKEVYEKDTTYILKKLSEKK